MDIVPLISDQESLIDTMRRLTVSPAGPVEEVVPVRSFDRAIEYMNIEMPELVFMDFTDPRIDAYGLLDMVKSDPWLLHGGIVAICADHEGMKKLDGTRGANIVVALTVDDLRKHLPRIMTIIDKNRRILFQREIGYDLVSNISGSFKLDNDPFEASCYANLICNFLHQSNRLDPDKRDYLNFAITEMLMNAIEHGNCGISYDEKSAWMGQGKMMLELIEHKCSLPYIAARKVLFEYTLGTDSAHFVVADEGEGFDWRGLKDAGSAENIGKLHGRGILVTRNFTRNLSYNEKGNEVSFDMPYQRDVTGMTPGLFVNMEPRDIDKGEVIFREGERSNFLYYIVKGQYDVVVNGNVVSSLSPDDVFMGEMSFLLNNRRSATVRAATSGKMIEISKKAFVEAIKKKPHYALFLSRLLAQRIQRANLKSSRSR